MEKIDGIIIEGKVYEAVKGECGKRCSFYNDEFYCQVCREFCKLEDCIFRYSPELTERLNNPKTKE